MMMKQSDSTTASCNERNITKSHDSHYDEYEQAFLDDQSDSSTIYYYDDEYEHYYFLNNNVFHNTYKPYPSEESGSSITGTIAKVLILGIGAYALMKLFTKSK